MVDSYVLKWAEQELLNGENNSHRIDFLFKLACRNINTFSNVNTAEQILRTEYEEILKDIEFEDLEDISHRVLIVIDGADELESMHEINNPNTEKMSDVVRSVYELIKHRI